MSITGVTDIIRVVRELNLGRIKEQADMPFAILVIAPGELGSQLAEQLSNTPGRRGIHPWVQVTSPPLTLNPAELDNFELALVLQQEVEGSEEMATARRTLHQANVPIVTVVVSEEARNLVGSELARQKEAGRVVLPSLDREAIAGELAPILLASMPEARRIALARQLPLFRPHLARDLIESTSRANALYAASTGVAEIVPLLTIPLAAADIIVLSKNQLVMAFKLALAAGKEGSSREILAEVVSVVGSGFLFRQIARELVGLIPVVGIVPKVAVSYAGTWVIGRTVYLWATEGERLNREEMRRFYDEAIARGQSVASTILRRLRGSRPQLPPPEREPAEQEDLSENNGGLLQRVRNRLPFV